MTSIMDSWHSFHRPARAGVARALADHGQARSPAHPEVISMNVYKRQFKDMGPWWAACQAAISAMENVGSVVDDLAAAIAKVVARCAADISAGLGYATCQRRGFGSEPSCWAIQASS